MEGLKYIFELCEGLPRSGPGDNLSTKKALDFVGALPKDALVLDIGCGQGMQTLELARNVDGEIIALDFHDGFLDILSLEARKEGLENKILTMHKSMLEMDFEPKSFDLIWSEGALYSMGFENGLNTCHELLKDSACLGVSELVYLTDQRPDEIAKYLETDYPSIRTLEENRKLAVNCAYEILNDFVLPKSSWLNNYYLPMEKRIPLMQEKYHDNKLALDVLDAFSNEIGYYKKYSDYYGYQFLTLRKV